MSLDKGNETAFMELSDPNAVSEETLIRQFSRLTVGVTFFLDCNEKKFCMNVLEKTIRQFSSLTVGDNVTINKKKSCIEALETKPDTKEVSVINSDCEVDFAPALDYKEPEKEKEKLATMAVAKTMRAGVGEEKEKPKFRAFTGVGTRLDGKSSNSESNTKEVSISTSCRKRKAVKLVFGSSKLVTNLGECKLKEAEKVKKVKKEEIGFQPFTGKSYKLSG